MKRNLLRVVTGASALVITGGVLAASAGTAFAAGSTPWEPDSSNEVGSLTLYDASGNVVTSGSDLTHPFQFAEGSTADAQAGTKAFVQYFQPSPGTDPNNTTSGVSNPGSWTTSSNATASTSFPVPTPPAAALGNGNPVATVATTDANGNLLTFVNSNTPASGTLAGIYQIRVYTSAGPNGGTSGTNNKYWAADVSVNTTTGTWTELYPTQGTAPAAQTHTAVTPATQTVIQGASASFTATVTPAATPGTVDFTDTTTGTDFGNGTYTASTGIATLSHTMSALSPTPGDTITATFTPTTPASFTSSSGTAKVVVNPAATVTSTTLTEVGGDTAATSTLLTATVSPSAAPGTVEFFDNNGTVDLGPGVAGAAGTWTLTIAAGFPAGSTHSLTAVFTPANVANYQGSTSPKLVFGTNAASGTPCTTAPKTGCTDTQSIKGTIPPGTLSISTPYTAANALDLGTLALSADSTMWTASKTFQCITVTDATSGGSPFVAEALGNPLTLKAGTSIGQQNTSGAYTSISPENLGLNNLVPTPAGTICPDATTAVNSYNKAVTGNGVAAASPAVPPTDGGSLGLGGPVAHPLFQGTAGGEGTETVDGTLTLNAPTSTQDGEYDGTIIFTVTD